MSFQSESYISAIDTSIIRRMSESKSDEESREERPDASDDDDDVRDEQVEDAMEQKDTALRHQQASKNEELFNQD